MAMSAVALRKPRARVMRALIWALRASARPLDGPPSRVAQMRSLTRLSVLASFTNSGMRQRCAQAITPRSRVLPSSPLTLSASRSCSLIRYPLYTGLSCSAMTARAVRWFPGRSWGFFRRARLPVPRAAAVTGEGLEVLALALAPGLLIDPDPPQPRQPVPPRRRVRRGPGHDVLQRIPPHPQFPRRLRPRHLRGKPGRMLREHRGEPAGVRGPRHSRGDLPMIRALYPRHLGFDERPLAVHIQRPPPAHVALRRLAARAALRAPAPVLRVRLHHDDQDLLRRPALPRPPLDIRPDHLDALDVGTLTPHP